MRLGRYVKMKDEGRIYKLTAVSLCVFLHPDGERKAVLDLTLELPVEGGHTTRRVHEVVLSEDRANGLISRSIALLQEFSRHTESSC